MFGALCLYSLMKGLDMPHKYSLIIHCILPTRYSATIGYDSLDLAISNAKNHGELGAVCEIFNNNTRFMRNGLVWSNKPESSVC